jgi:hypothetical protein
MTFTPPRYAARYDWEYKAENPPGNTTQGWLAEMAHYCRWRKAGDMTTGFRPLSLEAAWARLELTPAHAASALSQWPVRINNAVGIVPPDTASRVFKRSLAKSIDADDDYPELKIDPLITSLTTEERSFKPPRYQARQDWRTRLDSLKPAPGSWQEDILRYWNLRLGGRKEEDAWADVAMSIENAKLALSTDDPSPTNDAGLIPCIPDGQDKDTVARRVFARSVAKAIDPGDIYNGLILDESE